jgi:hypothetical protein
MWSKLLNLFFIQMFILQVSAFASPGKYLTVHQVQESVTALKQMSTDDQKRLYLSILPLINKEDIKLLEDPDFFISTIKNLSIEGDSLVVKVGKESARITDIDFKNFTAKFNGKPLDLKKSIKEQIETLIETETKTSFVDYFISSAHAQGTTPPVPNKLKVIGILIAGSVAAVLAVGGIAWGWLSPKKGTEAMVLQEVEAPKIEEMVTQDCNKSKDQVKRTRMGEIKHVSQEFIQSIKDKYEMMDKTISEAKKLKMAPSQMKWMSDSKSCYGEVIELIEVTNSVNDDSNRAVKEVPTKSVKKPLDKKASKQ